MISRRALLGGAAVAAGCGRRKSSGFPGIVVVANRGGNSVAVVDMINFTVPRRIGLDSAPDAVVAAPLFRAAYVLCPEDGKIHEIDGVRRERSRSLRLGSPAISMRIASDGNSLWVLCRDPYALVRVGLPSLRVTGRVRLHAPAADFDVHAGGLAAVAFPLENRIGLAAPGATACDGFVPVGNLPSAVRFQGNGEQILVGNRGSRSVSIVHTRSRRLVVHLPLPIEPVQFCFNADGGQLFVSGPGADAVSIVYPYTTEVAETVLAGRSPAAMAASSGPDYLFVANPPESSLTVLDIETRKLIARVGVGTDPGQILLTPDNQYAMVLNRGTGDMAVIRIPTLRVESTGKTRRYTSPPLFNLIPIGPAPVSAAVLSV